MDRRRQEILGILLIALGIFLFLSLISYDPLEEPSIPKDVRIHNWMGILGVYVSHYLIKYTIGVASYVIPLLLILWGWWVFANRNFKSLLRFTVYILILAFVTSIFLSLPSVRSGIYGLVGFRYSGLLGGMLCRMIYDFLGFIGTIIFLVIVVLVDIRGYFSWSFYSPIEKLIFWRRYERPAKLKKIREEKKVRKTEFKDQIINKDVDVKRSETIEQLISKENEKIVEKYEPKVVAEHKKDIEAVRSDETKANYKLPPIELLNEPKGEEKLISKEEITENSRILEETLETFGLSGKVVNVSPGPIITRYEVEPASGVRVGRIAALADDLARVLKAKRIRIVAPIPGTSVVGVEIPNRKPALVYLREIISSEKFQKAKSKVTIALGKTTSGDVCVFDLATMPHLLIAGATGSGKSVCINTIIASILFKAYPNEVKFLLIDPKKLELSLYRALKGYHLLTCEYIDEDVITRADNALVALRAVEAEMERRYDILANAVVRNIEEYNNKVKLGQFDGELLPYIVVIIDELADLMLMSSKEVEDPITRLAQMSRAVGIHLVIATQRPSVDVITGLIKANFPSRIAFQVASKVDSRTIIDANGAEKLLGRGDMLIVTSTNPEPQRLHNAFISLDEVERILAHIIKQPQPEEMELKNPDYQEQEEFYGGGERDPLFEKAMKLVIMHQQGSISLLQRRLKIGFARAARIMDQLEMAGIVGPAIGSKPRDVLVGEDYLEGLDNEDKEENNF